MITRIRIDGAAASSSALNNLLREAVKAVEQVAKQDAGVPQIVLEHFPGHAENLVHDWWRGRAVAHFDISGAINSPDAAP